MPTPPLWSVSTDSVNDVSAYCRTGGYEPKWLLPIVYSQSKLEGIAPQARILRSTPAFSIGGLIPPGDYFVIKIDRPIPVGLIALEYEFGRQLTTPQRRFIVAHEYSHVVMNHAPYKLLGGVAASIAANYISTIDDRLTRTALSIALVVIETTISCGFNRQCEMDADANAVALTGDRAGGIETIRTLGETYAGGTDEPSHWITRGRASIPVVTYQERIDAL
jgi:Zn-dependent protease with chaperone function